MKPKQSDVFGSGVATALLASGRTSCARLPGTDHVVLVRGALHLDGGGLVAPYAPLVTLALPWNVTEDMPRVTCHEPWIIDGGAEWHLLRDGNLCYELPPRWSDHIKLVEAIHGTAVACTYAAEYLLNSVQWLLDRHKFGYQEGLVHWPAEWPGWPHNPRQALGAYLFQRAA